MACRLRRWFSSNRSRIENVLRFEMRRSMNDIPAMKTVRIYSALALGVLAVLLLEPAQAASRYRYVQYRVPPRHAPPAGNQTNQTNRAKPAAPQENPVKFKDLPLKTEFYFLADKDRKLFPRIKISDTSARTVPTPGNPNVTTSPVPADTQVIAKKANADGKDDKKDQGDKGKKP
jgi:hypothetical protein